MGSEIAHLSYVRQQQTPEEKRWKYQKIRKHLTELEGLLERESLDEDELREVSGLPRAPTP
ncbi:MAG TPA: hypothetical protein VGL99_02360 [Chloroflexota bacterium]